MSEIQASFDKMKSRAGKFACYVWIVASIYFHIAYSQQSPLFSLKAVAFILVGMFLAAFILGSASYYTMRLLTKFLIVSQGTNMKTESLAALGCLKSVIELVAFWWITGQVHHAVYL